MPQSEEQKVFENGVEGLANQLDTMDATAQRQVIERVADLRARLLDQIAAIPVYTGPDGRESLASAYFRTYESEMKRVLQTWSANIIQQSVTNMRTAGQLADTGYRRLLNELASPAAPGSGPIKTMSPIGLSDELVKIAGLYQNMMYNVLGQSIGSTVTDEIRKVVFGMQDRWDAVRNIRSALAGEPKSSKELGKHTAAAVRIERTSLMSIYNASAAHVYQEAESELPGMLVEWTTAGQKTVCDKCRRLDKKRKKPKEAFPGGVFAPPLHPQCRCRTVAWMPGWD